MWKEKWEKAGGEINNINLTVILIKILNLIF